MNAFIGRKHELELLNDLWNSSKAEFLILFGRRRVGKTTLLVHWIHSAPKRALYWVAEPGSALVQLRSFSQAIFNFDNPHTPAPAEFTYASWEQAWRQVASMANKERLALFVDEFTYLLETDPTLPGKLQNLWDQDLKETSLFLCLSGSHMGMMKREFLSYQAPLYGRATAQIHLQPLPFGATKVYFPNYSAVDRVTLYSIFGGVPAYWERVDQKHPLSYNIRKQLLTANNLMQAEPRLLLQDFISDPHNYVSILESIARGARTPKEIEAFTGLSNVHIPKYLSVLNEAGFVERRVSVTDAPGTRSGRHHITDPYLRFYYRFLASRQEQLAMGIQEQSLEEINRHMTDFIGTYTWEELCREWTLRAGVQGELPFLPDRVGSAWNNAAQIDVVGINRMEKTLLLGECKWTAGAMERKVLSELVEEKAKKIVPDEGRWNVFFVGFSRSGWTNGAVSYAQELNHQAVSGNNWRSVGMRLLDLAAVDEDLGKWTEK